MKYKYINNVLAAAKRTNGASLALMILGLATLLFLACPEPDSGTDSDGTGGTTYMVTFMMKGGSRVPQQSVVSGGKLDTLTEFTKAVPPKNTAKISKYVFYKWYKEEELITSVDVATPSPETSSYTQDGKHKLF